MLAVKLYGDVEDKPDGIPDSWPAEVKELNELNELPDSSGLWQVMSNEDFLDYRASVQAAYDDWYAAGKAQVDAEVAARKQVRDAMSFGNQMILEFSAINSVSELTSAQIIEISGRLAVVQRLLMAGALQTAIDAMDDVEVDELLPQELLDMFAQRIRDYMGV